MGTYICRLYGHSGSIFIRSKLLSINEFSMLYLLFLAALFGNSGDVVSADLPQRLTMVWQNCFDVSALHMISRNMDNLV